MADRIKGITIEIDGQTTGLKKALSDVTSQSINVQKQLNDVNRLLKFDPGNTTLLTQKQELLSKQIEVTSQKLKALKDAQAQVDEQFKNGKISESQYKAFQREIVDTEARLKSLEGTLKTTSPELQSFGVKAAEAGEKLNKIGGNVSGVGSKLTMGVTAPLLGIAGAAIKVGNDFEAQMSRVKAISGATGEEFEALKQQALDLGQSTAFSANEVAQGQENLASAGFSTNEIMAAMPGLLDLAASSGEDLATSSDIAASTLRGFGLAADQAGHVADVLAKNAGATNAAVADTGEAMKYVAPAAKAAGLSLEEVTAAIGIMANSGIKGSQAGTTLRSALTRLASPAKEAKDAMAAIGFSAFDSQGKMLPLKDMLGNLKTSLAGLTDQEKQDKIATIFGQESMSGVLTLIDAGSDGLDNLTQSLKASDGAAADMASTMQDNAKSGIEQMFGALETAGIKIQEALAPTITAVANFVGNLATAFSNLSPTTQKVIIAIAGIVAAIGPVLIFIGKIVSAVGTLLPILAGTAESTGVIGTVITALSGPIGIIIAAIASFIAIFATLYNTDEEFRNSANEAWEEIKTTIGEAVDEIKQIISTFMEILQEIWAKYGDQITKIVIDKFNGIKITFQTALNAIKDVINIVLAAIKGDWNGVWEGIKQLFIDVWNGIIAYWSNSATQLYDTINLFTGGALTSISNFFNGIIAWFMDLPNQANLLWQNITTTFNNGWNSIVIFFTQSVPAWLASMGQWFSQLPNSIAFGLGEALGSVMQWGADVYNYLTTNVPLWISSIGTWFSQLPSNILTYLTQVISDVTTWGSNMLNEATNAASNTINAVVNWFSQLPGNVQTWLTNTLANITAWGSSMLTEATTAATNTINGVVTTFTQLPGQILTYLSQCVSNMTTWGSNMLTEASTGMQNVFNGIVDTFTNLPSKMVEIGTNIVQGLINGIKEKWNSMTGWLGGLCDSFISGVEKKFDINSPSRVMKRIGGYIGEGLAIGIGDTVSSISKQANAIADAAMPNINAGSYNMGVNYNPIGENNIGSTGGNIDAILAKMDSLADAITNMKILMDSKQVGKLVTPTVNNNLAFNSGRKGW